jgi:ferrous iron transport protein B
VEDEIIDLTKNEENARFLAMLLLEGDDAALKKLFSHPSESLSAALTRAREMICGKGDIFEMRTVTLGKCAGEIAAGVTNGSADRRLDTRLDRIFTGRLTAYPVMLAFFALIFWITITGANYPSKLLSSLLFSLEKPLRAAADFISLPPRVSGLIIDGAYRTLAWVVSVMLPPMAIFFPLFTLLEDAGYLPRIAYNLDRPFKKCNACGKQALTMCMGFGCNAAGVVGSRIIDSKKERLLAVLTNNFVPCNGRFPTLIALISMFFVFGVSGFTGGLLSALSLTSVILLSVAVTLLVTKLISVTLLRGESSDFVFELPPYRPPQLARVIVRSVFDRTLHVLARSAAVAAPAGALIWILANTNIGGESLLAHGAAFLDPLGRLMGLDGVILLGFILGLPANEIVLPIILMIYTCGTSVSEITSTLAMREVLAAGGFTRASAVCMIIFTLMHFPCSTTLITIKKETGSIKWTLLAALIPTVVGMILCMLFNLVVNIISLI